MISTEAEKLFNSVPDAAESAYSRWSQPVSLRPHNVGILTLVVNAGPENDTLTNLAAKPPSPPDWIFDSVWQAGTIGLFTGDGGVGKTHATLQMLRAIAAGAQIQNTPFICPTVRPVVYITQEDEAEFVKDEFFVQDPTLKNLPNITNNIRIISTAIQGANIFLQSASDQQYLIANIPEKSVFVLDSWSTFIQCNENDNTELLKEITALRHIMKATGATPLLIHHRPKMNAQTGVQSSFRGGTALPASCRFQMMLAKSS